MDQADTERVEKVTKTLLGQLFHAGDVVTLRFESPQCAFLNGRNGIVVGEREHLQSRANAVGSEPIHSYIVAVEGEVKVPPELANCLVIKSNVLKIDERFIFPRVG